MRTGPVALGYLDRTTAELVASAGRVAQLTHWEDDNVHACALWCLAIRHAIMTGVLDMRTTLDVYVRTLTDTRSLSEERSTPRSLSEERSDETKRPTPGPSSEAEPAETNRRWSALIDEALTPGAHPRDFNKANGWVVRAFQGALAAVAGSQSLPDAVQRAVRGGNDTDTVAAIAGSLAGAVYGGTAVPLSWKRVLHGWPGIDANELTRLAYLAARHGEPDAAGWPLAERAAVSPASDVLVRHPHDDGVWIGSIAALDRLPDEVDAVVSLCRVGTAQVPAWCESVQVWLVDQPDRNIDVDFVLSETVDAVSALRAQGKTVFVHCFEARSRTAAVAATLRRPPLRRCSGPGVGGCSRRSPRVRTAGVPARGRQEDRCRMSAHRRGCTCHGMMCP
ncbi:ADP-ribosylglycohydrolase family protein [Microbacterium elymi]